MMKSEWKRLIVVGLMRAPNWFPMAAWISLMDGFVVIGLMSIARTAVASSISALFISASGWTTERNGAVRSSCKNRFAMLYVSEA